MTVHSAYAGLTAAAGRLRDTVRELELIAVSDRPRGGDVLLVDEVANAALETMGAAEQARAALGDDTPASVALCQSYVQRLGRVLVGQLAAPEHLTELAALGTEHRREAGAWADEVIRCVQACQQTLWHDTLPALLAYWQEIAALNSPCSTSGARR
ncbi:hypothetical protein OG223_12430 [Streptomyces sp. NBC_01478]|uniref:hypothetical protein n=1 Tax=Streptomyces sp. NBC_01478 TaxID=2903882 RepID=UPI002E36E3E8|nr:hypothetical protein [Streptomyces sp. NBC_01478]